MAQVHKQVCSKVPNALMGRDSGEIEVYGMEGIPIDDLLRHHEGDTKTTNLIKHDILTTNPTATGRSIFQFLPRETMTHQSDGTLLMPSSSVPSMFGAASSTSVYSTNPIFSALLSSTTPTLTAESLSTFEKSLCQNGFTQKSPLSSQKTHPTTTSSNGTFISPIVKTAPNSPPTPFIPQMPVNYNKAPPQRPQKPVLYYSRSDISPVSFLYLL